MTELIEGTRPEGLTPRELADEIKVRLGLKKAPTAQTIRNWMAGGMPCLTRGDHGVASRLDPDACERWIRANRSGLGRGGEREKAGRKKKRTKKKPVREARGQAKWRNEADGGDPRLVSDEMLDEAERKAKAAERMAELAGTSGAEAAIDPEVIALERQVCKLTHADLVLLAHLTPEVSGLSGAAVQRLEKLETIQARQVQRHKDMGLLLEASGVRRTYETLFGELRAAIDAMPGDTARELAAALELDGEGFKKVERVLKARAEGLVDSLREIGAAEAAA